MHDPQGRVELTADQAIRCFRDSIPQGHFIRSGICERLVRDGSLMEYRIIDERTIASPRVRFVSYPHEWTDAQLAAAASLTLAVSEAILEEGWELKDASAWNVVFKGTRPVFCDHSSFQRIARARWWAFAQFVRHFVLPLAMARLRIFDARTAFMFDGDGLQPERARAILGARRFLTRYWPLMLTGNPGHQEEPGVERGYHRRLYALLDWMMGARPGRDARVSAWRGYRKDTDHYPPAAAATKRAAVARWLEHAKPSWVLDLGCNVGEYTLLARRAGARVIAIDFDHDSVQSLYRTCPGDEGLFPVVANLADMDGGRGWDGRQYPGLAQRLAGIADLTLMLALVHHLAISQAIPCEEIAAFASRSTGSTLIVELIDGTDPMAAALCAQRGRDPGEFGLEQQHAAFAAHFRVVDEIGLPGMERRMLLCEPR